MLCEGIESTKAQVAALESTLETDRQRLSVREEEVAVSSALLKSLDEKK